MDVPAREQVYPRVVIEYCTQCKWMLRAAYVRKKTNKLLFPLLSSVLSSVLNPD
jgi:predicted Rdx family selenoprotein